MVALHNDFAAAADGGTVATLAAQDIGWAGKYDGNFALDATAKSPHNLAVTVNVQDWFIWPWVFIFLGAVLAWRTVLYEDQRRSKELLRERLKELANGYRDLMRLPDGRSPAADARLPYSLHGILPLGEDATDWHCPHVDALTYAERLYCDIDAPTQEGLNSVRDNIAKIGDMLGLAKQIKDAAAGLRDAARQIGALAPQPPHVSSGVVARTPAIMDEINLILTGLEPLGNRNEAQDRSSAMQNQTDAVALWRHAWQLYRAAADLYDTLVGAAERSMSDPDRAALHASDPRAICAVYLWPAKNLAELQQADVLARLREANRVLLALADRYQQALTSATLQARTIGVMTITLPSAFTAPPQPRADERTAAQILVSVQRHDLRDFLIAFGLTTLAFLLTIYPDKNFGSVWQYVAAFTAGATGQVAIAWKLLPWYRSYNAKSAATAT